MCILCKVTSPCVRFIHGKSFFVIKGRLLPHTPDPIDPKDWATILDVDGSSHPQFRAGGRDEKSKELNKLRNSLGCLNPYVRINVSEVRHFRPNLSY